MELLHQLLQEAGADMREAVTWIPSFGAYLQGVKRVDEFSSERICAAAGRSRLIIVGENLAIEKYFGGDLFVKGEIKAISYE